MEEMKSIEKKVKIFILSFAFGKKDTKRIEK